MSMLLKNKKTILKLLIIFTLCPVIFLSKPHEVTATLSVIDGAHIAATKLQTVVLSDIALNTSELIVKETILDAILYSIINVIIEKISDSTVGWINSGFEEGPTFVTDLGGFLTSVGNNTIGEFIEGSELAFLCSPFSLDIKIALTKQFGGRKAHCTLTDVFGNANGALNDLGNDWSWNKFNNISQPQNNAYGAYLNGYIDLTLKMAEEKDKEIIKSDWGGGFLSFDSCEPDIEGIICDPDFPEHCEDITTPVTCTTKTPGTTINESLNKVLGLGNDRLVIADEINEIVGALLSQLIKSVFNSTTGLFESNPSDNGFSQLSSAVIEELVDIIEITIKNEGDYREWKQRSLDAVNLAENYIDALIDCWQNYPIESISQVWEPGDEIPLTEEDITNNISALEIIKLNEIDPLQESLRINIDSATININNRLQPLIERINAAIDENGEADPDEILSISNDFSNLGGLHTNSDVLEAQYEFEGPLKTNSIQFKMNTIISNILIEKTSCEEGSGIFIQPEEETVRCILLSASPTNITAGESSTISWSTLGATLGFINLSLANVITMSPIEEGSVSVTPGTTTTYTATLTNEAGETITCVPITITVDDTDENTYNTVEIGTQFWMAENLNVGTMINSTTGGTNSNGEQTNNSTIEKYCYDNDEDNCTTYGGLYKWDEMMQYIETEGTQGICSTGWHLPTDAEWYTLENYLATGTCDADRPVSGWDCDPAGTALKELGSSDFEALLSGYRDINTSFYSLGTNSFFWSSSVSGHNAWRRYLHSGHATVARNAHNQGYSFSVRCLLD